jgi:hypothetical protein
MSRILALWAAQAALVVHAYAGTSLQVSFSATQADWIAGEPVILKMTVTNSSQKELSVFLGEAGVGAISFSTNGHDWVANTLGRRTGLLPGPTRPLEAHTAFTNYLILDEWMQLGPGLHRVQAQIAQPAVEVLKGEFTLRVLPYDAAKLRERVVTLVKRAGGRWSERYAAITALRALYRRSPGGQKLLKEDLRVERELMGYIEVDPVD